MADADCITSAGVSGSLTFSKETARGMLIYLGVGGAHSQSAATTATARSSLDWLPRPDEVWFDTKTGRPSRRFYLFMREIAQNRLGGVYGKTVTEVDAGVQSTQASVAETTNYATRVGDYAEAIAAAVSTTTEVLQDAGTPASGTIPDVPSPPGKPGSEEPPLS